MSKKNEFVCDCIEDFEKGTFMRVDKVYEKLALLEQKIDVIGQKLFDLERMRKIEKVTDSKEKTEKELEAMNSSLNWLESDYRDWFTGKERY